MYQITLLLYDGLAQNLLIELLVRIRSSEFTQTEQNRLKFAVKQLICTAGVRICASQCFSLIEMLQSFAMGMDCGKMAPCEARPQDLGLLQNINYVSPEFKVWIRMSKTKQQTD